VGYNRADLRQIDFVLAAVPCRRLGDHYRIWIAGQWSATSFASQAAAGWNYPASSVAH
jgi:hypothetical protein